MFVMLSCYSNHRLTGLLNNGGNSSPQCITCALDSQIPQMNVGYMRWNRDLEHRIIKCKRW
jgi:hypothetical protein